MRILVVRTDVLGDAIVTSPFIEQLANSIPNPEIDILCTYDNYPAFKFNPFIQETYILNHIQGSKQFASNLSSVVAMLNQKVYDLVLVLNGCYRTYKYVKLLQAKKIIARCLISKSLKVNCFTLWQKLFSNFLFFSENTKQHEVLRLDKFYDFVLKYLQLPRTYSLPSRAKFYLENTHIVNKIDNSLVINASGKVAESRYINDSLLFALIKNATDSFNNIGVVVFKSDVIRVESVINNATLLNANISIISDDDIFNVAKNIAQYECFIGADGGLCHLAAGLGISCVTIFDKQDSTIWHPWTERQISLQAESKKIYDISYLDILKSLNSLMAE